MTTERMEKDNRGTKMTIERMKKKDG